MSVLHQSRVAPLWARIVLYAVIGGIVLFISLAWQADRNMVRRWIYPLRAELSVLSTRCDQTAPVWLKEMAGSLARRFASPSNQLALMDAQGRLHGCVNGWTDTPFFSDRIRPDTQFRLASLSKIVSFVGLTYEEVQGKASWLDTPLIDALGVPPPFVDSRLGSMRVRHLLNHSAGFDRFRTVDAMVERDKKPWCPYASGKLGEIQLDFPPGTTYAYANIGYCLAAAAYEKRFGTSLWTSLESNHGLSRYGIGYLEEKDSPVHYSFLRHEFYGKDFIKYFDWHALRGSMGMVGSAQGLAHFVRDHQEAVAYAINMHGDVPADCNDTKPASCYDGFLERHKIGKNLFWNQKGYLYGMSAMFITDGAGNVLIWLGSGDAADVGSTYDYVERGFGAAASEELREEFSRLNCNCREPRSSVLPGS